MRKHIRKYERKIIVYCCQRLQGTGLALKVLKNVLIMNYAGFAFRFPVYPVVFGKIQIANTFQDAI